MNEPTYCVIIINHDAGNSYAASAFSQATQALKSKGVVRLEDNIYMVSLPVAAGALLALAAIEMRQKNHRALRFCLGS